MDDFELSVGANDKNEPSENRTDAGDWTVGRIYKIEPPENSTVAAKLTIGTIHEGRKSVGQAWVLQNCERWQEQGKF